MKNVLIGLIASIFLTGCTFKVHHIKEPTIVEKRVYVPKYVYKTKYKTKYVHNTRVKYVPKVVYRTKTKVIYKYKPYPKKKKIIYKYY